MRIDLQAALAVAAASLGVATAAAGSLQDVRDAGRLRVGVYVDFAPFSDADGKGIDVDVAQALAAKLGLAADVFSFKDADDVDGDLRNVVWKGHYLRKERLADVMMHVPLDPILIRRNEQVRILAPYYRERLAVARNLNRIPQLPTLSVFSSEKIGVQFDTIEDHYLVHAFGGLLRENVVHFATTGEAVAALRRNEVAAVMGRQSHIEAALAGAAGYGIAPVATPGLPLTGWNVGVAVKADNPELAGALEQAMASLREDGTIERIFTRRGLTFVPPRAAPGE
jgi:polar amino acid transport system substrate-binding protein